MNFKKAKALPRPRLSGDRFPVRLLRQVRHPTPRRNNHARSRAENGNSGIREAGTCHIQEDNACRSEGSRTFRKGQESRNRRNTRLRRQHQERQGSGQLAEGIRLSDAGIQGQTKEGLSGSQVGEQGCLTEYRHQENIFSGLHGA